MKHSQTYTFSRSAALSLVASIAVALLTLACFQLGLDLATTAFLYLIIIVLLSLQGSFLLSAVFSLIAVGCLAYYFAPPIFSFQVGDPLNAVAIIAFLTTSAVITHLVSRVRKSAEGLRQQANLLNLTHDTIFVRDMDNVITYWNRGAEELYGRQRKWSVRLLLTNCCRRSFRRHLMRSMRSCCAPAAGKASSCTPRQMEPTWT